MLQPFVHRRDSIIYHAIEIIDELGVKGLSSREIAKREAVSEGTLFRHFKNMNDIILTVLDQYSQFDNDIMATIRLKTTGFHEGVRYWISTLTEYYESYPPSSAIVHAYDVLRCDKELAEKVESIFKTRCEFIVELCERAKNNGELSSKLDSEYISDVIIGFSRTIILKWRMSHYNFSLKDRILFTLETFLRPYIIKK